MFTIIGGDGKEYGPVSAEQIRSWIASGRANLDTQAKAVGSEDWRRLGDYPEFNGATGAAGTGSAPPPPIDVSGADAKAYANELMARGSSLDVSACFSRAFEFWKAHLMPLAGVTLLVMIVQLVAGMIPILGMLSSLLLNGVFYGGIYYYYLGRLRGEPREVGDAFAGFSRAFVPLMLATLFTTLITIAIIAATCAPLFFWVAKASLEGGGHAAGAFPSFSPIALVGFLIGFVVIIYLSVAWAFTFMLVIDQGLKPWTAMEVSRRVVGKRWFSVFVLILLGCILALLGIIALFVGIIFTLPLIFAVMACAYESMFCPRPRT